MLFITQKNNSVQQVKKAWARRGEDNFALQYLLDFAVWVSPCCYVPQFCFSVPRVTALAPFTFSSHQPKALSTLGDSFSLATFPPYRGAERRPGGPQDPKGSA